MHGTYVKKSTATSFQCMMTNDERCTREIKSRIAIEKTIFKQKKNKKEEEKKKMKEEEKETEKEKMNEKRRRKRRRRYYSSANWTLNFLPTDEQLDSLKNNFKFALKFKTI
jgi:hypothetical protein